MQDVLVKPKNSPNTRIERTNHTPYSLEKVYGERLHGIDSLIGFGEGNSAYLPYLLKKGNVTNETRLDADYGKRLPIHPDIGEVLSADARYCPEIPTDRFDVAISSYLLQHLSSEDQVRAMAEMLRVTRPNRGIDDKGGIIMIYPVFRPAQLMAILAELPEKLRNVIDCGYNSRDLDIIEDVAYPNLDIKKSPDIETEAYIYLFGLIAEHKVLSKRIPRARRFGANLVSLLSPNGNRRDVVRAGSSY